MIHESKAGLFAPLLRFIELSRESVDDVADDKVPWLIDLPFLF